MDMGKGSEPSQAESPSRVRSWWRQPKKRWLLGIPVGGFLMFFLGIAAWLTFDTFVSVTNSEAFCADACHSMRVFVKPQWIESSHFSNRTGVRATCADCHVPNAFVPKMIAKAMAVKDLYHEIVGTIQSRKDFEEHRLTMAERVWRKMRRTDSRNCRDCHNVLAMDMEKQGEFRHSNLPAIGRTCIDCHKGIAHDTPELPESEKTVGG